MRRGLLGVPLAVAILASLLLLELWRPSQAGAGEAPLQQGTAALLQPFERIGQGSGESRLERARRTVARRRAEVDAGGGAQAGGKKNASERSLQQAEGHRAGRAGERQGAGQGSEQGGVAQEESLVEQYGGVQCNSSQGGGGSGVGIGACFSLWAQLTTAQTDLQEAIQLKWQANRLHDEAWFMVDRLDRSRALATRLRTWFLNHTQPANASAPAEEPVQLQGVLEEARARGIPVSDDTQHEWEEWHYIAYHFPGGTGDAVRAQLHAAEAETRQQLDEREEGLRSAADAHYRLKGRFAGECVGDGFPPALLAAIYSGDERRVWLPALESQGQGNGGGPQEAPAVTLGEQHPEDGDVIVERYGDRANTTRRDREVDASTARDAESGSEGAAEGAEARGDDLRTQPGGVSGAEVVWRAGKEHWYLQRDLFPGEKNVSFILQYFKHPNNVQPLVAALAGCDAQMPGLTSELLANVDNPEDADVWLAARNGSGDFVVPVFSHNIHEERAYNRLARMATGAVLVFLQDDQLPPSDCSWLGDLLAAFAHYPRLAIAGLNTGVYSSQQTGWRMSALNGDNVYLRSAAINVDMQFVLEVDLAPLAMRRRVFDAVGGFNEAYSRPGEGAVFLDYELCIRTWLAGHHVAQLAMIPGMRQSGPSGTRSGRQLAIRMKNEGMNGVDFSLRLAKFMPGIDAEVLRLNQQLEPVYPDYPRPWEAEPPWQDSTKRPIRLPRFSSNRTETY